jgi:hypothetical protein
MFDANINFTQRIARILFQNIQSSRQFVNELFHTRTRGLAIGSICFILLLLFMLLLLLLNTIVVFHTIELYTYLYTNFCNSKTIQESRVS